MNQSDAADVARTVKDFYAAEGEGGQDLEDKYGATFDQAYEQLPDGAVTALVQRVEDNAPMLVAFKDKSLYMLTVEERAEGAVGQPPTNCVMLSIEPGAAVVEVKSKFWTRDGADPARRSTTWLFKFKDGPTLEIPAHFNPEVDGDGRDALGQALARALGWELPGPQAKKTRTVSLEAV